jgi:hypothetical protein
LDNNKEEIKQQKEKIALLAKRGKENFYFFMRYILGSEVGFELIDEIPHKEICDFAQNWNKNKKLILTPRDTFKTTILVVGHALWLIIRNPNVSILFTSDKMGNSIQSLAAVKEVIENHVLFKLCYGELKGDSSWTEKQIKIKTRTGSKRAPTIMATGADSEKVGMHFDFIFFDDPHNRKNISTPEQILKIINYYKGLHPLLDSLSGRLQITATRWHHQDVNNHVMTEEPGEWDICIRSAEWEEDGVRKFFYPKRLTPEFLGKRKKELGTHFYSLQYQNEPTDEENALFKKAKFKYFNEFDEYISITESDGITQTKIEKRDLLFFVSVDPSGSGNLTAQRRKDYSGFVVVGVDFKDRWFVFEAMRKRGMKPSDIIEQLFAYHYKYKPEIIGIEAATYCGQIKYDLEKQLEEKKIYQKVKDLLHHNVDKAQRIRGLQPLYERGKIYHAKGLYDLELELLTWSPNSTVHDDLIDSEAYLRDIVYSPDKGTEEVIEKIDVRNCPNYLIAADLAWKSEGCRGSFFEFIETFGKKQAVEFDNFNEKQSFYELLGI